MRGYRYLIACLLACALSACGSAPPQVIPPPHINPATQAYWENPLWQAEMFNAVQSKVHIPANLNTPGTHGTHGTVRFQFDDGIIKNPVIVASTGDPDLDKLMLQQVASAQVPKPTGPHADEPHEFELPLNMPTPFEWFENNVYAAIDHKKLYPRDPILKGKTGSTTVDFDYLDAKASHIVIVKSSGNKELDQASVGAVSNAELPAAPPGYAGKTLHMVVIVCYCINSTKSCPTGKNVLVVEATRTVRVETTVIFH